MRFKHQEREYRIRFSYGKINDYRTTHAMVTDDVGTISHMGLAMCNPGDNFCRETGRKYALTRALGRCSKAFRTMVWKCYLGRKNVNTRVNTRVDPVVPVHVDPTIPTRPPSRPGDQVGVA